MRPIPPTKMDEGVLRAVAKLKKDSDFQKLLAYLIELHLTRLKASCITSEDVKNKWLQGAARELDELLHNVETCEDQLEYLAPNKEDINHAY